MPWRAVFYPTCAGRHTHEAQLVPVAARPAPRRAIGASPCDPYIDGGAAQADVISRNSGMSINSTFSITRSLPGRDRLPVRAHVGHRTTRRADLGLIRTGDHNGSALRFRSANRHMRPHDGIERCRRVRDLRSCY